MKNVNSVHLVGRIGTDPESRTAGKGSVTKFRLAVNESWKNKSGEWQEKTHWISVETWDEVEASKGDTVFVTGKLDVYEDEKDGKKRSFVSVKANGIFPIAVPVAVGGADPDDDDIPF